MSSPDRIRKNRRPLYAAVFFSALTLPIAAHATLPSWLQHIVGASTIESAVYRAMQLPSVQALYPRPPKEAATELSKLIAATPTQAELYQLRARADEDSLNPSAAESDWKLYVTHATDPIAAKLELADFYQRRLLIPQEIATLRDVALAPALPSEAFTDPITQRSWLAFERILGAIDQQGLPAAQTSATFTDFLTRYPDQPAIYAADLQFQLDQEDYPAAESLITRYTQRFPQDAIFPIRARALLEYRRGNLDAALAVYDHAFQPLWPTELIQSYLALLDQTHRQRAFVAAAREDLAAHPDGPEALNALARIVDYEQQSGRTDAALQTLDTFRTSREARNAVWSPTDLYTLAALANTLHATPEVARYDYALASTKGNLPNGEPAAQAGLAGLIDVLLSAPEQPLAIGSQNLTLYRDIATLDQGPGFWNGILSLWLNGTNPASEYTSETTRAQSYFHRSKAAELLSDLDHRFPSAPERPGLHAALIHALSQYGEPATVITSGKDFLAAFPSDPHRLDVASLMADAYAQQNDTSAEFALYESQLAELSTKTSGLPLTTAASAPPTPPEPGTVGFYVQVQDPESVDADAAPARKLQSQALAELPTRKILPEATAYATVLDRYLGRLTSTGNLPRALTVLRSQLDHNPNDPLLYERLTIFLQQNNLSAQQEQVFEQAISKFQQPSWSDKLARLYLREQKREAFTTLLHQVTNTFSGTDLDVFFAVVSPAKPIGPQLSLQLNLYAAKRFPHDLTFTQNLLAAYQAPATRDTAAYEALLRSQWWASDDLRDQFLAYLSRTRKLDAEIAALQSLHPSAPNPAATRELAELNIFTSHFEQAAPLLSTVADLYPADPDTGGRAVSLFRSLAYLDPTTASTQRAVAIETNLLAYAPDNPDRLATLGDLFAEATSTGGEDLTSAAPYWHRIPELHSGSAQGFLTSSTIFWDYFQFDSALAEIASARTRFHSPNLFGFEAGAIQENRHDLPSAIAEYTSAVIHPIDVPHHVDSALGTIAAWLKPPSDAADSNFRSTAQNFFGSEESRARLLQLANRTSTRALVDSATSQAIVANPSNTAALTLRADILSAQHHALELSPLLTNLFSQALDHTSTLDEAAAVGSLAEARNLTPVYERALAKQVTLTPDPVQKIELQYDLARSLESHNDIPAATRIIDAVYTANPRILGVVRSTTDFYLRTNRAPRAISTLLEAAKAATPSLARDFTLEAAGRANDANDTAQARSLALTLLAQTPQFPLDARVLDILATSYARAHDDAGLKQFYLAQLDSARTAPNLSPDARKQDIALLRRGLIPALTRLNDFPGATGQYITLISAFPEDTGLANEAALYTLKHSCQPQLLDFLNTTVKQSPRDSRFMVLLAQTQTTFGDLPAAVAAYSLAINIRKDRVDLYSARAEIETRLSQTDPHQSDLAAADFERLYLLTYHDPSWMIRAAEVRARQQRPADAVRDLQTAYIDGHAKTAADFFTVANRLALWNLLPQARTFADQAVTLAGADLLTPRSTNAYPQPDPGAVIYARILTRLGLAPQAIATLIAARQAAEVAATSPSVMAAEFARQATSGDQDGSGDQGTSDEDASAFRKNFATQHRQAADNTLRLALTALGQTVQTFYSPEQKQALALELDKLHATSQSDIRQNAALVVATSAGLTDREAAWRKQTLVSGSLTQPDTATYIALQDQRLQFSELAHTLESFAARLAPNHRATALTQAAYAYSSSGDFANELRVTRPLALLENSSLRDRFFSLLLHHNGSALPALASSTNSAFADSALNYAIAHAPQSLALAAVHNRAQTLPAVWSDASTALVQTYFAGPTTDPVDTSAFDRALATNLTLADRLATPPDPKLQLTGDIFFPYAATYGVFLSTVPKTSTDAEDFLPASLEANPSSTIAYLTLARTYAEAHNIPSALTEYGHALELSTSDPAIEDEIAVTLYRANRHDDALTHWHAALAILANMQQHAIYPESWFTSLETMIRHIGERNLTPTFRPEIEAILIPYLAKNGTYRSNELLHAIFNASAKSEVGARFLIAVSASAPDPNQVLSDARNAPWFPTDAFEPILLREIALTSSGPHADPPSALRYRYQLIDIYLSDNHIAKAQAVFDTLSASAANKDVADITGEKYRILLATRSNHLQTLLDAWHSNPDTAPSAAIDAALVLLLRTTDAYTPDLPAVRPLQEFAFDLKRQNATLLPIDFLSLAQLRLDTHDLPGALDILRQLTLLPPSTPSPSDDAPTPDNTPTNPYLHTDQAAALLEKAHLPAEAIPFLQSLVASVPWDASFRLRLAQAQLASNARDTALSNLLLVARNASAPYELRLQAARALAPLVSSSTDLSSQDLNFLAHPTTPAAARQPYAAESRLTAAALPSTSPTDREALLREAIAIAPTGPDTNRARVDLTLLQSPTSDPAILLAIFASLQNTPGYVDTPDTQAISDTETPTRGTANNSPSDVLVPPAYLPSAATTLDLPTQIRLATLLSSAHQRDGTLGSALAFAQFAVDLSIRNKAQPSPDLIHRRDDLRQAILLARGNALRRPTLHPDLAQTLQVRPRLTPATLQEDNP